MRRRAFLAAAGTTLFAGCGATTGNRETTTPRVSTATGTTPATRSSGTGAANETTGGSDGGAQSLWAASTVSLETGPRALSVPAFVDGSDGAAVAFEFTATATADHPATLAATLTNQNRWTNTFRLSDVPAFESHASAAPHWSQFDAQFGDAPDSGRSTLYLAPTANHDLVDRGTRVRRGDDGYWEAVDAPVTLPETVRLDAGESVHGEYYVVGDQRRTGFPTGEYRFGGPGGSVVLAAWNDERPGPTATSRYADQTVPTLPGDDATPWYHDAAAATRVFLEPSAEAVDPPASVGFRLLNHSGDAIAGNPYRWRLSKLVDGSWYHVAPFGIPVPLSAVYPGRSYGYDLFCFHGAGFDAAEPGADRSVSVGRLGGGRYAFQSGFSATAAGAPAALFRLHAPQLALAVPDGASVHRDGSTVVVTLPSWNDGDGPPNATLTVERAPDSTPKRTYIAEQVAREWERPLEAALAPLTERNSGATRVVVRTDVNHVDRIVNTRAGGTAFSYRGRTYRATADRSPSS